MPFNPAIPQAPDLISVSQGQLLGNNTAIPVWQAVNHYEFGTGVNEGKHRFLTLPNQAAAPAFAGTDDGIYNLIPTVAPLTTIPELFVHKQRPGGGTADIPMTASILSTATPAAGAPGWTYLPSGIIMKWGIVPVNNAGATTIAFDATMPFSAVFAVTLGPTDVGALNYYASFVTAFTNTDVTVINRRINVGAPFAAANVYYFAIGR